ncbi:MAG: PEP-CTERM sorting domain-containing protein [Pseudomonadota bacterium]
MIPVKRFLGPFFICALASVAEGAIVSTGDVLVVDRGFRSLPIPLGPGDTNTGSENGVFVAPGGELRVDGGSQLSTGQFTQDAGQVVVSGAGSRITVNRSRVEAGQFGHDSAPGTTAVMVIEDGGAVVIEDPEGLCVNRGECFIGQIGNAAGSTVAVTIRGEGSILDTDLDTSPQTTIIGDTSVFTLEEDGFDFGVPGGSTQTLVRVSSGGTLETGDTWVAQGREGPETVIATVIVEGAGSSWNANAIGVGFHESDSSAPGTLGSIIVTDRATVRTAGGLFVGAGGFVGGDGEISGDVFNFGGIVAPGTSPGNLTIDGDFRMSSGVVELEIGGIGVGLFDSLSVAGLVEITGGEILFDFVDDFVPDVDDLLELIVSDGGVSIADAVTYSYRGLDAAFNFSLDASGRLLASVADVPEPASFGLLAFGIALLSWRSRSNVQKKYALVSAKTSRRGCSTAPVA